MMLRNTGGCRWCIDDDALVRDVPSSSSSSDVAEALTRGNKKFNKAFEAKVCEILHNSGEPGFSNVRKCSVDVLQYSSHFDDIINHRKVSTPISKH
mmetsp:Transcript_16979/g.22140  ORF Transcript_16979/g.22140 Transcript_16979/m.22140 type:complete len:96 (-) Transcript_16979:12-299(-)